VGPIADIAITKTLTTPTPDRVGALVGYQITLENIGSAPATGIDVRDMFPSQLTFVSSTFTAIDQLSAFGLSLNPGQQISFFVTGTLNSGASA
jgi:uncharacterized repeat protein (TIGR01451 family)